MDQSPSLEVEITSDVSPGTKLVVGAADPGVSGLSAIDYLVSNVETTQIGYVSSRHLPDVTPFTAGRPRHPIRLYSVDESEIAVLVSEVFLPIGVADQFADALTDWVATTEIDEITMIHGAPFQHAEEEHVVSHVATDEYRERHLVDADEIPALAGGFFDGALGELLVRGMEADLPPVGILVTPSHPPGPDLDGALRLLKGLRSIYGIEVDETALEQRAEEMRRYYRELSERMQNLREGEDSRLSQEYPHDRMYM